ncbi:NLR family, CARD domain containing 5 isoform X1 [Ctenopharyngodon idella]|uniref:NLR family, CARD domain containing 5 isoform X1 n=1 Tax=Ctenopharyngodon idella TaxID=7959 RepID=UPI002230025B|nr:NLR family, CARD domain containing 5 isoform X1 [Ctenopharyngodon idella]XP_051725490.1 NLR family, CARD domain containing 5 isoform X1 [Ctenopharyngodon idella]
MRMEREDWSVGFLVAQEASALVDLLCKQNSGVLDRIFAIVDPNRMDQLRSLTNNRDLVSATVDYFRTSDHNICRRFLSTVYQYCENIPFYLETTVLSVAEHTTGTNFNHTSDNDNSSPSRNVKRPRLDYLQSYTDALKSMVLQKHETVTQTVVKDIHLDDTWVYLRQKNPLRVKDRTIQPQASLDNHEGEESEHKVSVESLLKTTGRVVVLLGQAGSGKTLLVHCLGRSWAQGSFLSVHLLFLLEFRQLNLISRDLSLKDLLFLFYPACEDEESEAVFEFILSNPEKVCFIFDGYDEFRAKLTNPKKLESSIDPNKPLPMTDLLSGLCNRKILPDCTMLITCRPRDVTDMFASPGFITCELQGFDRLGVKEYAEQYFHEKGDELKKKAVNLLMDNRHLLSMSHVPGLCHICCVCVDHLFSSGTHADLQLPTSLTQIYMQILLAFLRRISGGGVSGTPLLQRYRTKIVEMSQLALKGLEESTIVFKDTEVPPELKEFGIKSGILSRVKLTFEDGSSGYGFTFMHLTMQEFLAALHLMTSQNITESQLKKKLNLKTRWTTKTDPKSVFTDSLHLYVCGLAAEACTSSLVQLQVAEGAMALVQKRQAVVCNVLLGLAGSTSQTGPKIVELCRCAHETQDAKLARAIGSRPQFELRNIRLNAVDMDSLAFVTAAADQNVCLDFGGCSLELDCLEILPSFKNVGHLIFRSRKYDDRFAEALCGILSKLQALWRLEFISGGLTDVGAAKLARALEDCPHITHLNVSDNSLKDEGIRVIAETLSRLPNISSVLMGRNVISTDGVLTLIERMAVCPSVQEVHIEGNKEISLSFSQSSDTMCENTDLNNTEGTKNLRFKQCNITVSHVASLCNKLKGFSFITLLDLSYNLLSNKGLKKILDLLPELGTIQEINVSENGVDMDGVVMLASALCNQKNLRRVDASGNEKKKLVLWFDTIRRQTSRQLTPSENGIHVHKKLSLTHCDIQPAYMAKLCRQLVKCKNLLDIEFSHLKLSNESIEKLMSILPEMSSLHLLNLSHVDLSTNGALLLVRSLADCQRVTAVELRHQAEAFIKFVPEKAEAAICKLTEYKLSKANVEKLSRILENCPHLSELVLSHNLLRDEGVKCFVDYLPKLKISSSVSLSGNRMTQVGALDLVNSMNTCEKVVAVEVSLGVEDQSLIHFVQEHVNGKTLRLRECSFEGIHLKKLVEILNRCPRLLTLELFSNSLQSQGLYFLLDSLAELSTIHTVKLRNNGLVSEQIEYFVKQFSSCHQHRDIRIEEPWLTGNAVINLIAKCLNLQPHIREIRVSRGSINIITQDNSSPSSISIAHPENVLPALQSISFDGCDIEGQHLTPLTLPIQKCLALQDLKFSQLKVDRKVTEFFSTVIPSLLNLRNLTLDLKGAAEEDVEALAEALPNTPEFESLSLSQLVLGDRGAAIFGRALQSVPNLKSFNLSQCSGWTTARGCDLVRGLVQCVSLAEIRLDSVVLDEEGITILAQGFSRLASLRRLSLNNIRVVTSETFVNGTGILCLLASFKGFRQMEEIELESWRMGDGGAYELVKYIPSWTKLLKLSLSDNSMTDQAGEKLLTALSHCRALQKLQLSKNQLGQASAAKLSQVLPLLPELSELNLSENQFDPQGCKAICEGLMSMKALKILHLTSIGSSDLVGVASSLKYCPSIEDVSLSWNGCGDSLAFTLAEILPLCTNLKRLDLEANKITTAGATAISKCLPSCPSIEVIRLWRNPIAKDAENLQDPRLNFSSV